MQSDHEFQNWTVIGKGTERVCLQNPEDRAQCVKLSRKDTAKQTYREIQFFERLKNKKVQFTHIPDYLGKVTTETQVGFKQQVVLDEDLSVSLNLSQYISQQQESVDFDNILRAISTLKDYLMENRIIPSDLVLTNILVQQSGGEIRLYLIDGFGNTEFIPLSSFVPYLMHRKINRKFTKLLRHNLPVCIQATKGPEELETYNKKADEFEARYL
ncbi:YrbL family protein [Vibrio mytili]|uniref:Protein kinase domain-containing protein n=1 Tax=Vibrio mytili TaxID=50718 RepID=A0A0C3HNI2_9VIBR|nr:YrbL family protein [Vibrio mytili]KIN09681.1 hypothetical protein SU60_18475 [Vibrio mytili]